MQPRRERRFSPEARELFPYAHEDILRYLLRHHPIAKHAGTKCIHAIDVTAIYAFERAPISSRCGHNVCRHR